MKMNRFLTIALLLGLPVCGIMAQTNTPPQDGPPGGRGGPGGHRRPPMPLIAALDANHDGILSADEIANAPAALKTLDKNGDGQLTKDEYLPPRPDGNGPPDGNGSPDGNGPPQGDAGGPPPGDGTNSMGHARGHRPVPPIVAALDLNGDGIISADEIAAASKSLLKLDKKGTGQLTMADLMGPRPQRGGGPGGPGGQDDSGNGPRGHRPPPDGQGPPDGNGPPGSDK